MKTTKSNKNRDEYIELSRLFDKWIHSEMNSEHTRSSYRTSLKLFIKDFLIDHKGVSFDTYSARTAFSKSTIEEWEDWLEARGNTGQTINIRRSNLLSFLAFLSDERMEYAHYYMEAKTISGRKNTHIKEKSLTDSATEAIINAPDIGTNAGLRDTVLMGLMYSTGARLGEVLSVKIKDLTFLNLRTTSASVLFHGKGNKYRCIPLDKTIAKNISLFVKHAHGNSPDPESYLFYSPIKGKYEKLSSRAIEKRLKIHSEKAHGVCEDVPLSMHSHLFRHTRATNWIKERHRLPIVSKLLGHEYIQTTMDYLDITPEMMNDAILDSVCSNTYAVDQEWNEDDINTIFDF